MLTPIQRKRLINNLVKSTDDPSKLTVATIKWICAWCWWLAPYNAKPSFYGGGGRLGQEDKKKIALIKRTFDVFGHFTRDIDLNYALGWINKWCKDKSQYHMEALAGFRERCEITQEFRRKIGAKLFRVKYYNNNWRNKRKYYQDTIVARSLFEAIKIWRASGHPKQDAYGEGYCAYKVRQISDAPPYYYIEATYLETWVYDYLTKPLTPNQKTAKL